MLIDARRIPAGSRLRADLCIVGAGAAGLSLALALEQASLEVLILEAGGRRFDPADQEAAGGTSETAMQLDPEEYPFQQTRIRGLGGTTQRWSGACLALDAGDFSERPWLGGSGWPFSREALRSHYREAAAMLGLPPPGGLSDPLVHPLSDGALQLRPVLIPPILDLRRRHGARLRRSRRITVITHAPVQELLADPEQRRIDSLRVIGRGQAGFVVDARTVVLAAGAIENARLLLVSRERDPRGIGNRHDLVGLHVMEHDYRPVALLGVGSAWPLLRTLLACRPLAGGAGGRAMAMATLGLADRIREREGLLNLHLRGFRYHPLEADPAVVALKEGLRRGAPGGAAAVLAGLARRGPGLASYGLWHCWGKLRPGSPCHWIRLMGWREQEPQAHNRITLSRRRDSLGFPLAHLQLRFSPRMQDSLERTLALLEQELRGHGCGPLRRGPEALQHLSGYAKVGCHAMGGTRMHADPRRGVVDADGRVHGLTNLYIAGGSLFPTGGAANPTLTLVALALRLARHLQARRAGG